MSLFCRACGAHLLPDSPFCPACGASQTGNKQALTTKLPAGPTLHQRYRLLHLIGQGGMGAIYVAQDTQLGDRLVAVKEMSMSHLPLPQAVEQFRREAYLLASLHRLQIG